MRFESIHHIPDRLKPAWVKGFLFVLTIINKHRDNNRSVRFSFASADSTTNCLNNVNLALTRIYKRNTVKRWNINTLGQASCVRKDSSLVMFKVSQSVELCVSVAWTHVARHIIGSGCSARSVCFTNPTQDFCVISSKLLRSSHSSVKRNNSTKIILLCCLSKSNVRGKSLCI